MRPHDPIEEPPPIPRYQVSKPARRASGRAPLDWRSRFGRRPRVTIHISPAPGTRRAALWGLAAIGVMAGQIWMVNELLGLRDRLAVERGELDQARISLGLLWEITERLDEEQIVRLGELADSIQAVLRYAQGEVRLWETAYYAQEQRLDEEAGRIASNIQAISRLTNVTQVANTRLEELARTDVAYATRVDALERQTRGNAAAVATLARRADAHQADLGEVAAHVGSLRQTLAGLDTELAGLENQLTSTGSAFGEMDTRVARLDGWIDGFRRAGLNGEAVENRLATLASELRRVTMRVDSLRSRSAATQLSQLDR